MRRGRQGSRCCGGRRRASAQSVRMAPLRRSVKGVSLPRRQPPPDLARGNFSPIMKKHTKGVDIQDVMALAVDRMQRHFEPMQRQVDGEKASSFPTIAPVSSSTAPLYQACNATIYRRYRTTVSGSETRDDSEARAASAERFRGRRVHVHDFLARPAATAGFRVRPRWPPSQSSPRPRCRGGIPH